jgi:hypothetical protein
VVDEAHHVAPDSTYDAVLAQFGLGSQAAPGLKAAKGTGGRGEGLREGGGGGGPRAFLVGFTATPFRCVCVCVSVCVCRCV